MLMAKKEDEGCSWLAMVFGKSLSTFSHGIFQTQY